MLAVAERVRRFRRRLRRAGQSSRCEQSQRFDATAHSSRRPNRSEPASQSHLHLGNSGGQKNVGDLSQPVRVRSQTRTKPAPQTNAVLPSPYNYGHPQKKKEPGGLLAPSVAFVSFSRKQPP